MWLKRVAARESNPAEAPVPWMLRGSRTHCAGSPVAPAAARYAECTERRSSGHCARQQHECKGARIAVGQINSREWNQTWVRTTYAPPSAAPRSSTTPAPSRAGSFVCLEGDRTSRFAIDVHQSTTPGLGSTRQKSDENPLFDGAGSDDRFVPRHDQIDGSTIRRERFGSLAHDVCAVHGLPVSTRAGALPRKRSRGRFRTHLSTRVAASAGPEEDERAEPSTVLQQSHCSDSIIVRRRAVLAAVYCPLPPSDEGMRNAPAP